MRGSAGEKCTARLRLEARTCQTTCRAKTQTAEAAERDRMAGEPADRSEQRRRELAPVRDERLDQLSVRISVAAERVSGFLDRPAHEHCSSVVERMCKCGGWFDPIQLEPERAEERRDCRAWMDRRADVMPKPRKSQLGGARPTADRGLCFEHAHGPTGLSQRDRSGEAVRPRPDNDGARRF
jgi:hypothetical protein